MNDKWRIYGRTGPVETDDETLAANAEGMFGLRVEKLLRCEACGKWREARLVVVLPSYQVCGECLACAQDVLNSRSVQSE